LGIDVQVIYPHYSTPARSYNRWMTDRCGKSGGRSRWVPVPPLHDIDMSIQELRLPQTTVLAAYSN
jgi:hypothetical protein